MFCVPFLYLKIVLKTSLKIKGKMSYILKERRFFVKLTLNSRLKSAAGINYC